MEQPSYQQNSQQKMLMQFFQQLPPKMQEKIQMLPSEKQMEVLTNLIQRSQQQQFQQGGEVESQQIIQMVAEALQQGMQPEKIIQLLVEQGIPQEQAIQVIQQIMQSQEQQFDLGGSVNNVPVEAEKNENITTQDGLDPEIEEGGYAVEKSFNPISGERTYELPNNEENKSHKEGGIKIQLSEGDVINSDKTKIPTDFKIYGKNFKSKTFKDASDYISKLEKKEEEKSKKLIKENKFDEVTQNTSSLTLAKLAINRNNLNNLQEKVLDFKKQNEEKELVAEYGTLVQNIYDKEDAYYNAFKPKERLIAQKGLNTSFDKFKAFSDKVMANPNTNLNQVMDLFKQSGLNTSVRDNTNVRQPLMQNYSFKNNSSINRVGKGNISDSRLIEDTVKLSKKYGIDPAFALATLDIESKGKSNAVSNTGATGLWQFTRGTGKQYGLINENGDKRKDYYANLEAGFRLAKDNQVYLQKNGLQATPENLYLAHQQGLGGAKQIISNALYGTPISAQVKKNMGHNWGSNKSGAEYLQYTQSKITPLVNYYQKYLTDLGQKNELNSISMSNNTGKAMPQKQSLPKPKNTFQQGGEVNSYDNYLMKYNEFAEKYNPMMVQAYLNSGKEGKYKNIDKSKYPVYLEKLPDGTYKYSPYTYENVHSNKQLFEDNINQTQTPIYYNGGRIYAQEGNTINFDELNTEQLFEQLVPDEKERIKILQSLNGRDLRTYLNALATQEFNGIKPSLKLNNSDADYTNLTYNDLNQSISNYQKNGNDIGLNTETPSQSQDGNPYYRPLKEGSEESIERLRSLFSLYQSLPESVRLKSNLDPKDLTVKNRNKYATEIQNYLRNTMGDKGLGDYLTHKMAQIPVTNKAVNSGYTTNKETWMGNITNTAQTIPSFMDGKWKDRAPVFQFDKNHITFPEGTEQFENNGVQYYRQRYAPKNEGDESLEGLTYYMLPKNRRQEFKTKEEEDLFIKGKGNPVSYNNGEYYFDPSTNEFVDPYINNDATKILEGLQLPPDPGLDVENSNQNLENSPEKTNQENSNIQQSYPKSNSILNKLKYGLRESLPYLDNLRLLRERRIMPVLQQKPYQNPYDNFITDTSIQSSLNDADRMYLTSMADSRGNPSVRNARMAQIMANIANSKNQMYTQKYNMDNQLKNQKLVGQSQYLNNWEDINRDLRKRYETEVLQTVENQRQQKHMARNKMMNDYLRKQEQNSSRDLALMETNYNWNPYNQQFEFDPIKAERNYAFQKLTFKDQSAEIERLKKENEKLKGKYKKEDDEKTTSGKYGLKIKKSY